MSLSPAGSPPAVADQSLGCFADYVVPESDGTVGNAWEDAQNWGSLRAFPFVTVDSAMTVSQCSNIAANNQSPFYGIEKGIECWCVRFQASIPNPSTHSLLTKASSAARTVLETLQFVVRLCKL